MSDLVPASRHDDEVFDPMHRLPQQPVLSDTQTFDVQEGRRGLGEIGRAHV